MTRRRILVPIDFSTQSDLALEYAGHMATQLNAMVSCIYVIEEQGVLEHKLRRQAEIKLSERVNMILTKEVKVPFELLITSGEVHLKILEKSIDLNAQIIVIGRSRAAQKRTTRIGSNAKKIVTKSLVPVIVVARPKSGKHKHLILPLDLEKPYSDLLKKAIEITFQLGAFVSVIAVIEKERSSLRPVYLSKLKEIGRSFNEENIAGDTHLLENQTTIPSEILTFSERIESGIILLMTRHERKSDRPYLGLMETEVLSRTEVPVLFLNPRNTLRRSMYNLNQDTHSLPPTIIPMEDHFI